MPETLPEVEAVPAVEEGEPLVLLVGFDPAEAVSLLAAEVAAGVEAATADGAADALDLLGRRAVAVLCTGPGLPVEAALEILAAPREDWPAASPLTLVLAAGPDPTLFQDWIAEDRVFYLSQTYPGPAEARTLLANALERVRARRARRAQPAAARRRPAVGSREESLEPGEVLRRLALQPTPVARADVLAEAARDSVHADRAACLLYDAVSDSLWAKDPATGGERRRRAAFGVTGFVLRSGLPVALPRAGLDPRYDKTSDDPEGDGTERLLAVPVLAPSGRATAVLVAVRDGAGDDWKPDDREALERLAELGGPHLTPAPEARPAAAEGEAEAPAALTADPLATTPKWAQRSYWILLILLAVALAVSLIGQMHEYASGTGVVFLGDRLDLTNPASGTVDSVAVDAGQRVAAGQVIVRFNRDQERAALAQLEEEFTLQLTNRLRNPQDPGPGAALVSLRAQRDLARAQLAERSLTAPIAGTIADLRVKPGQLVSPGQVVASIVRGQVRPSLLILLPGEYRPRIKPGMPVRLELNGYPYRYLWVAVDQVGEDVVGPAEAMRYVGPEIADGLQLDRPVVLLTARLPGDSFTAGGRRQRFHNGMLGTAEVQIHSEKILLALVPGIRELFEKKDR